MFQKAKLSGFPAAGFLTGLLWAGVVRSGGLTEGTLVVAAGLLFVVLLAAFLWLRRRTQAKTQTVRYEATVLKHIDRVITSTEATRNIPVTSSHKPDNLLLIEGIGPRTADVLRAAGINSFRDLSKTDVGYLEAVLEEAGIKLADPRTWPEQSRLAAAGEWDRLRTVQDRLRRCRVI